MDTFLTFQLDYISFVHGFAFILFSGAAFFLYNSHKQDVWKWLAIFGFFQGTHEWFDIYLNLFGDHFYLRVFKLIIMTLSFICLFEAASTSRQKKLVTYTFVLLVLFFVFKGGHILGGITGIEILSHYCLGCVGALVMFRVIPGFSKEQGSTALRFLRPLSYMFLLYALSQLVVPKAAFFPANFLNSDSFILCCRFPIQVIRTLIAIMFVVIVWSLYISLRSTDIPVIRRQNKIISIWLMLSLSFILMLGWHVINLISIRIIADNQKVLFNITKSAAAAVNPRRLESIQKNNHDFHSPDYQRLLEQQISIMRDMREPRIKRFYLLIKDKNEIVLAVDSITDGEKIGILPKSLYEHPPIQLTDVFIKGVPVVIGPYKDPRGILISFFVPIKTVEQGHIIAVQGVDVDANIFFLSVRNVRLFLILFILLLLLFIIVLFITKIRRSESEERLRLSEAQYRAIFDNSPVGIVLISPQMKVLSVNQRIKQWFPHINTDMPCYQIFNHPPLNKPCSDCQLIHTLKDGRIREGIIEHPMGSGLRQYRTLTTALFDIKGNILGAIETLDDITDRLSIENNFRKLSQAMEQSQVSVVITNSNGEIEYVNPFFVVASGYSLEDLAGKNIRILKSGFHSQDFYREIWETLLSGHRWAGEIRNRKKNGEFYWESVTISPIIDLNGKVTHFVSVKEDINVRKLIEDQLIQGKQRLYEFINAIPNPVFFKNSQGVYEDCNLAFAKAVGLPIDKIIGRTIFDIVPYDKAILYNNEDQDLIAKGGKIVYETKLLFIDGKEQDILYYKAVVSNSDGSFRGIVGSFLDISVRKRMEIELRANEEKLLLNIEEIRKFNNELEKAQAQLLQQEKLAAIGFLAAGVAHEINNPLGFIQGNLFMLEQYINSLLEIIRFLPSFKLAAVESDLNKLKEAEAFLSEAEDRLNIDYVITDLASLFNETKSGIDRIKNIVLNLKRFSRSDSGEKVWANINDVIESILGIVFNELKYKSTLVKEYGVVPSILCNTQQLGQVFINILLNAVQSIPEFGAITIRTFVRKMELIVEISDTGAGISEENLSKIFDPFFTTKDPGKGTGLGLSLSCDIIKKHNGWIEVKSVIGKGTSFFIHFNLSKIE